MTLDSSDPRALYAQLADQLRGAIERGELAVGARLPSEHELIAVHGVSRPTIRRAVQVLRRQGLVATARGRGSYVLSRRPAPVVQLPFARFAARERVDGLGPFEAAAQEAGLDGDTQLLGVGTGAATVQVAARLELEEGVSVIERRRLMSLSGVPVQVSDAWYPAELFAGTELAMDGKVVGGVYAAMERAGHRPDRATEEVGARAPTSEEAHRLQVGRGAPVLTVVRTTRGADGRVLEVLQVIASAQRLSFVYEDLPI